MRWKVAAQARHAAVLRRAWPVLVFGMGCLLLVGMPSEEVNSVGSLIGWGLSAVLCGIWLALTDVALPWSRTFAVAVGSVLVLGPFAASVLVAFAEFIFGLASCRRGGWISDSLFNMGRVTLATALSGLLYVAVAGEVGRIGARFFAGGLTLLPLFYFLIDTLLVSSAVALGTSGLSVWRAWKDGYLRWPSIAFFGLAPLGVIAAALYLYFGLGGLAVVAAPLAFGQLYFKQSADITHLRWRMRRSKRIEAMFEFTNEIGSDANSGNLLRRISDAARRVMQGDASFVCLVRDGAVVRTETSGAVSQEALSREPFARAVQQATRRRRAVSVLSPDGVSRREPDAARRAESGIDAILAVPLVVATERIRSEPIFPRSPAGWMEVVAREGWDDDDVAILSGLASVSALAIDQAMSRESGHTCYDVTIPPAPEGSLERREVPSYDGLIGDSPAMRDLYAMLARVIGEDVPILLVGENGTGKELVARVIYNYSARRNGRFVAVDCGAISDTLAESELFGHRRGAFTDAREDRRGLLEEADGGVAFLDQIESASPRLQTRLLRFLEGNEVRRVGDSRSRSVDVRVIAATNEDLAALVEKGRFRRDLYFRLNGLSLGIPALRDRVGDVPLLVDYFLKRESKRRGGDSCAVSAEAMRVLDSYDWPGNVRELEHEIMRLGILVRPEKVIKAHHLSARIRNAVTLGGKGRVLRSLHLRPVIERIERNYICEALRRTGGNKKRAADMLGLTRQGLSNKIRRYGIPSGEGKARNTLYLE